MSSSWQSPSCDDCKMTRVASKAQRNKSHTRYGVPLCPSCFEKRLQLAAGQQPMKGTSPILVEFDEVGDFKLAEGKFSIGHVRFVKINHDRKANEWLVVHRDGEPLFKLTKAEVSGTLLEAVEERLAKLICGGCGTRLLEGERGVCGPCEGTAVGRLLALRRSLAAGASDG